jgi:hypothetical protein
VEASDAGWPRSRCVSRDARGMVCVCTLVILVIPNEVRKLVLADSRQAADSSSLRSSE